eukprot:scaffold1000_cov166-Amphora_coffeaeformis.AAC.11
MGCALELFAIDEKDYDAEEEKVEQEAAHLNNAIQCLLDTNQQIQVDCITSWMTGFYKKIVLLQLNAARVIMKYILGWT